MENTEGLELIKKAYRIDMSKIDEGYLCEKHHVFANNSREARSSLFEKVRFDDMRLNDGNDITYLNIPVVRDYVHDLCSYNGMELSRTAISGKILEDERIAALDSFLADDSIKYCYIRKRGGYYRPNSCGYTEYKIYAGVYDKEYAVSEAKSCEMLKLEPIDIDKHNAMINDAIADLKRGLINEQHG